MKLKLANALLVALAMGTIWAAVPVAHAAIVTDWVAVVGSANIADAATNSPTFTPSSGDSIGGTQAFGVFPTHTLVDGQTITASATLEMDRIDPGLATNGQLNTQLRMGLFSAAGAVPTSTGNNGIIAEYRGPLRQVDNISVSGPFGGGATSAALPNSENGIPTGEFITGTPISVLMELSLTRVGSQLDIATTISNGSNYTQNHSLTSLYSPDLSQGFDFSFNRVGFLLGGNANATSATLVDVVVNVTSIPEPNTWILALLTAIGGTCVTKVRRRSLATTTVDASS